MSNLTKEAIDAIEKYAESYYPLELGYDDVITTLESTVNIERRNCVINGAMQSLLDPTIYQAAGLMTVDEAYKFFMWTVDNSWRLWDGVNLWFHPFNSLHTTTDLLTIFRQQAKN